MHHRSNRPTARRTFLRGCGLTLAGFGATSLFPGAFVRHAMAQSGGGADALSS